MMGRMFECVGDIQALSASAASSTTLFSLSAALGCWACAGLGFSGSSGKSAVKR